MAHGGQHRGNLLGSRNRSDADRSAVQQSLMEIFDEFTQVISGELKTTQPTRKFDENA
jgi:hypothetical protein